MAKTYGDRWQIVAGIQNGGQAEVFTCKDLQGQYQGELILKRVRNPKRHDRFRAEVEATKRLDHPNIIRLIDHSALSSDQVAPEKQFLVMPYAKSGDLSSRVGLYRNNLDSVLQVAKSVATALHAAHLAGVIHRDVKPQNILFPEQSHDLWLADFGICLIQDFDRSTQADEVVGPVQFMAPELEQGGHLEVTAAADVYSLGKVIFYMLSGGTIVPRERLHEASYAAVFAEGERHRLLHHLLSRMICALDGRISSMADIITEITRIQDWERSAAQLPISQTALTKIESMKRKALEVSRDKDVNADIRTRRAVALSNTTKGTVEWFFAELEKVAAALRDGDLITAGVREVSSGKNDTPGFNRFRPGQAAELWIKNKSESSPREHLLRFSLGSSFEVHFTSEFVSGSTSSMKSPSREPEHTNLMLVPAYGRSSIGSSNLKTDWLYFKTNGELYRHDNRPQASPMQRSRLNSPNRPQQTVQLAAIQFSTAQWPTIADNFPQLLQSTIDTFIGAMDKQWI